MTKKGTVEVYIQSVGGERWELHNEIKATLVSIS